MAAVSAGVLGAGDGFIHEDVNGSALLLLKVHLTATTILIFTPKERVLLFFPL